MRPQHHIYTSGLGYMLNSVLLECIVLASVLDEKARVVLGFVQKILSAL